MTLIDGVEYPHGFETVGYVGSHGKRPISSELGDDFDPQSERLCLCLRELMATRCPLRAKLRASVASMPPDAPVIKMTFGLGMVGSILHFHFRRR